MKSSFLLFSTLIVHLLFNQGLAHEVRGEKVAIGQGYAYTYIQLNAKMKPVSLGIALSKEALQSLPDKDSSYSLKLPSSIFLPPYHEIIVNWNAFGHEPPDIYGIPHFDFHFYTISKDERESIMCMGDDLPVCTKSPIAEFIPPFYIPTPGGVPMMGWHWLDSRSPELNGKRFTSTFIYGFYNGEMIFLEPMITREFLLNFGSVAQDLSLPSEYAIDGYYPKKYNVHYDTSKKVYRIVMKDLELRMNKK